MLLATLMFTIMVGFVKVARGELGSLEIVVWRAIVSAPLVWLFSRRGSSLRLGRLGVFAWRVGLGFAAMACFFHAARELTLADLSLINKLRPILLALLAPVLLGQAERAGVLGWVALTLGLAGSAVLIGPDLAMGNVYGLWAFAAAVLSALAHAMIRRLGRTESPDAIVLWFQVAIFALAGSVLTVTTGRPVPIPSSEMLPYLLGCGVSATAGQLLMTHAYHRERATLVAAAAYSGPLWGIAGDLLAFGVRPSWEVLAGGVLIVAAGLMLVIRPVRDGDAEPPRARADDAPGEPGGEPPARAERPAGT